MSGIFCIEDAGNMSDENQVPFFRLEQLFVTNDDNTNDVIDLSQNDTSEDE